MQATLFRALIIGAISIFGLSGGAVLAAPKVWVCTIAVDAYTHLPKKDHLNFCTNDARLFVKQLQGCGLIESDREQLIEFVPTGENDEASIAGEQFEPTWENIRTKLPEFLSRASEEDTVIVYAAMHGALVPLADGKTRESLLLPINFKPSQYSETSIPLSWLRQQLTEKSQAKNVILFMDACHSGGIGAPQPQKIEAITSRSIGLVFNEGEAPKVPHKRNVYTLVSCADNQRSAEFSGFKQGVFSFWLGVGLDGAADSNGDTLVTMDELFQFVSIQVSLSTSYLKTANGKSVEQTPVRFLLGDSHANPTLFRLPILNSARPALQRVATVLRALLENYSRGIAVSHSIPRPRVLITEFGDGDQLGGRVGSLGKMVSGLLEEILMSKLPGPPPAYGITMYGSVREPLRDAKQKTLISDIAEILPKSKPGADILVQGSLLRLIDQQGDRLQLKLQVTNLHDGTSIASVPITFQLDADFLAQLPPSEKVEPHVAEVTPPAPKPPMNKVPSTTTGGTPLLAAPILGFGKELEPGELPKVPEVPQLLSLPIEVYQGLPGAEKMRVDWLPEDPQNPYVDAFETEAGQEIEIRLKNPSEQDWIAVIVQIDGLNQIGRKLGLSSESRYWLLPPGSEARIDQWLEDVPTAAAVPGAKTFEVNGNKLLVTEPPESIAGRQNLREELGEIRILTYDTEVVLPGSKSAKGDVGIGAGTQAKNEFMFHRDRRIDRGRSLGTQVIYYQKKSASQ